MITDDKPVSFDDLKELAPSNSEDHLKIKEIIAISRDQSIYNKSKVSLSLYLYD